MSWQFSGNEPLFIQIARRIRQEILCGKYRPDEQIPSVRQLAFEASVNPNTMQKALCELEREGLLYARGTVGRFVTADGGVLEAARRRMKRETMEAALASVTAMGVTVEELIAFLSTREADGEAPDATKDQKEPKEGMIHE